MTNLVSILKKQRRYFADKGLYSQSYGFFSSHIWMWEVNHKEGWVLKNWCFWTVVLEKTLESPLDFKEIKPINPKENQSWIFIGRTDAKAETPILGGLLMRRTDSLEKDPDAGKDWRQEEKGTDRGWWLDGITDSMDMSWASSGSWWWTGKPGVLQSMGSQNQTQLSD